MYRQSTRPLGEGVLQRVLLKKRNLTGLLLACLATCSLAGCETDAQQQARLQYEQQTQIRLAQIQADAEVRKANYAAEKRAETAKFRAALMHKLLIIATVAGALAGTVWGFFIFRAYVIRERIKGVIALSNQMTDEQRQVAIAGLLQGTGADARALLLEHKR